jgi:hypothetical protein
MTIRTDTPYIDDEGHSCDGCGDFNTRVVMVGEVLTIGEDVEGDRQSIHPESNACDLCRACLVKALRCFDAETRATETEP